MHRTIHVLTIIAGVLAIVGGAAVGGGLGFRALVDTQGSGASALEQSTVALAVGVIGVSCGALLIWAGAYRAPEGGGRGGESGTEPAFRLAGWGWWLLALLVVLAAGQAAFNAPGAFAPMLPIFHVLAGSLAALLFLSLAVSAARSHHGAVAKRAAVSSFAWGALGGAGIAIVVEVALFVAVVVLATAWLSIARPGLLEQLQSWLSGQMQNPGPGTDLGPLADLARSPLAAVGILLLLAVAAPLIEETTKSLAVPLVYLARRGGVASSGPDDAPRRPVLLTRLDGYLIGVAAGAGFTLLEGILNGSLALASPAGWAGTMLLRAGTAAVHCFATGLGGLGWQALLVERRAGRGIALWLAAAATHGIWNAGAGLIIIVTLAGDGGGGSGRVAAALLQALIGGFMALAWLGIVIALPLVARSLAQQAATPPVIENTGQAE